MIQYIRYDIKYCRFCPAFFCHRMILFVLIHSQTESKFLINTEISRTMTSVKHRTTIMVIDKNNVTFHVEEHSFTNNVVLTKLSPIYLLFISALLIVSSSILASSMPTCSCIRYGTPQFDHEFVGEAKVLQIGIVYRLGKVYAVAFALSELPDLRGCNQN